MYTNITIFPISSKVSFQLLNQDAFIFLFYPALPIVSSCRNEHMLCICCHGAIDILFSFDLEASRKLLALACRTRTSFDDGKARWCGRKVYLRLRGIGSLGKNLNEWPPAIPEYEHGFHSIVTDVKERDTISKWKVSIDLRSNTRRGDASYEIQRHRRRYRR